MQATYQCPHCGKFQVVESETAEGMIKCQSKHCGKDVWFRMEPTPAVQSRNKFHPTSSGSVYTLVVIGMLLLVPGFAEPGGGIYICTGLLLMAAACIVRAIGRLGK